MAERFGWRDAIRWGLTPGLLGASMGATALGLAAGGRPSVVVMAVIAASALPVLAAQRLVPAEPGWRGRPRDYSVDLLHLASTGLSTELFRLLTLGAVAEAAGWLSARVGAPWPAGAPWAAQVPLALLLGEAFAYAIHRACHRVPLLWRIHAMHHSSERMYAFAAGRNHPLNAVLMHAGHVLPAALCGAPPEVLALCGAFTGVHGLLQHCNVDLRHGWLNGVLATAELHRWHHSADRAESQTNFGNNLIVWDRLFGTCALPPGRPARVGLDDGRLRPHFLHHLLSPLNLRRQLARDRAAPAGDQPIPHSTAGCPSGTAPPQP
jgi:sterol desaturase/sphingolipid hydroxylase (fatty acid hydroxylase superfamily)